MKIEIIKNKEIIITHPTTFNARHILDSGQVFRYREIGGVYEVISLDKKCKIITYADSVKIETNDTDYFYNYFDLANNYEEIIAKINQENDISYATEYGKGIRIVRQNIFETIINFIISANNNIPRIKGIIDKLCNSIGAECMGYHAFPTISEMVNAGREFYNSIGTGYRADYLYSSACMINEGFDLNIDNMDTSTAKKHLMKLKGVGPKVADCILLFAYHRMDVFPVDTWITKIYMQECKICANNNTMNKYLVDKYGDLSGYVQQYLFYYIRDSKLKI